MNTTIRLQSMTKLILVTVLMLSISVLSGCTKPDAPEVSSPAPEVSTPAPEISQPAPSAKIADRAIDAEGVYNGQIDNQSIEIQMSSTDFAAFRTEAVGDLLEGLDVGDRVKFSYEPNAEGQLVLTSIEKMK